jgi:hypothetical protein
VSGGVAETIVSAPIYEPAEIPAIRVAQTYCIE